MLEPVVFESITTPLKIEARDLANFLIIAVALGLSAMIAFMFGAVAIFLAVQRSYGGLYASFAEIGYCLIVTAVMVAGILVIRSKARRRAMARAEAEEVERRRKGAGAPPMWKDAGVLATAAPILLKVVQFGSRNKTGIALVTGGLAAAFTAWQATKAK
jgi:hypothetical protein